LDGKKIISRGQTQKYTDRFEAHVLFNAGNFFVTIDASPVKCLPRLPNLPSEILCEDERSGFNRGALGDLR
jgi:hypothetical protein